MVVAVAVAVVKIIGGHGGRSVGETGTGSRGHLRSVPATDRSIAPVGKSWMCPRQSDDPKNPTKPDGTAQAVEKPGW